MFVLNILRRQAGKNIKRSNFMQIHSKAKFKDGGEFPTFNDVPIPQGSWKENYSRQQKRYMAVLLSGIASLVLSVLLVANSDKMMFNFTVPDYPYDEEKNSEEEKENT